MIKDFEYLENDLKVYRKDIERFIPGRIIDFHIHIWKNQFISNNLDPVKKETDPFFSFDSIDEFTFRDFEEISGILIGPGGRPLC